MNIIDLYSIKQNMSDYVKEYELRPGVSFHVLSARPFDLYGKSTKREILDDKTINARAEALRQLVFAGKKLFKPGMGGISAHSLEAKQVKRADNRTTYHIFVGLHANRFVEKQLREVGKQEEYQSRIDQRYTDSSIFKINVTNNYVSDFARKNTPFRAAISKKDKELLARYDKSVNSEYDIFPEAIEEGTSLSLDDMAFIFKETYNYFADKLESVNVEVTDENITELFALSYYRSLRVLRESFAAMPYLKFHKDIDKSLAVAVGEGLSYEKLLLLNVVEYYPANMEEFSSLIKAPSEWIPRLIGL